MRCRFQIAELKLVDDSHRLCGDCEQESNSTFDEEAKEWNRANTPQMAPMIVLCLYILFLLLTAATSLTLDAMKGLDTGTKLLRISEASWRSSASAHQERIRRLLGPGLTSIDDTINSGRKRASGSKRKGRASDNWTALDPVNPVYNFLIEYYGLKGAKGVRRLARWSPEPSLLVSKSTERNGFIADGILLEGADENDIGDTLHLRGAMPSDEGIIYNPSLFFGKGDVSMKDQAKKAAVPYLWYRGVLQQTLIAEPVLHCHGRKQQI